LINIIKPIPGIIMILLIYSITLVIKKIDIRRNHIERSTNLTPRNIINVILKLIILVKRLHLPPRIAMGKVRMKRNIVH
jgi:hypothetical protein